MKSRNNTSQPSNQPIQPNGNLMKLHVLNDAVSRVTAPHTHSVNMYGCTEMVVPSTDTITKTETKSGLKQMWQYSNYSFPCHYNRSIIAIRRAEASLFLFFFPQSLTRVFFCIVSFEYGITEYFFSLLNNYYTWKMPFLFFRSMGMGNKEKIAMFGFCLA